AQGGHSAREQTLVGARRATARRAGSKVGQNRGGEAEETDDAPREAERAPPGQAAPGHAPYRDTPREADRAPARRAPGHDPPARAEAKSCVAVETSSCSEAPRTALAFRPAMDPIAVRMLLVYDGSSVADRALEVAIARARTDHASITLLGVVAPRLWRAKRGQFQVSPEKHDEEFAREQLDRAKRRCREAGIRVETRVRKGPPAHVIAEEAGHGFLVVILAERRSLSGAPLLCSGIAVPDGTEVVGVL